MVKHWKRLLCLTVGVAVLFGATARHFPAVITATQKVAVYSATLLLWEGLSRPTATQPTLPKDVSPIESTEDVPVASAPAQPPEGVDTGKVKTTTLSLSAANTNEGGVHVSNQTGRAVNVTSYLEQGMPFQLTDSEQPQVLIVHTHATESYASADVGYYVKSASTRSTDNTKNTVAVGEVMADLLNQAGIVTINDHTQHDYPNYTGSYTRSAQTIQDYLKKYPSIQVVIDLHRDAIAGDGDTKLKPTAQINGKAAAQVMILAGCESGSVENFPHWEENFRFCLQLQRQLETDVPHLARPLSFKSCKYNFNLLSGSILIEVGTDANTLSEAIYSAELLTKSLIRLLQP